MGGGGAYASQDSFNSEFHYCLEQWIMMKGLVITNIDIISALLQLLILQRFFSYKYW